MNRGAFQLGVEPVAKLIAAGEYDRYSLFAEHLGDLERHLAIDVEIENGNVDVAGFRNGGRARQRVDDTNPLHAKDFEILLGVERDQILVFQEHDGQFAERIHAGSAF